MTTSINPSCLGIAEAFSSWPRESFPFSNRRSCLPAPYHCQNLSQSLHTAFVSRPRIKSFASCSAFTVFASTSDALELVEDRREHASSVLTDFEQKCATPVTKLQALVDEMVTEMQDGLDREGAKFMMIPTYVDALPTGDEEGVFYALDLGGTNFRVLRVQLGGNGGNVVRHESKEAVIPPALMHGTNKDLFDFIATALANFVSTETQEYHFPLGQKRKLGFTFSFPIQQKSISSGTLIFWTKGFAVVDTVGKDVVEELQAAMVRQGLDMEVAALVNDTVGTLARGRYKSADVMISVILGTGTNACYVERTDKIGKLSGKFSNSGYMVINTEWGCTWSSKFPRTEIDELLDVQSINPGDQFFEKMTSGMYLGEIVRLLLLKIQTETQLFGDTVPSKLSTQFSLATPHVSIMHHDTSSDLTEVAKILEDQLGVLSSSLEVRKLVVQASDIVAKRAARLVGAAIVGLLKKIGRHDNEICDNGRPTAAKGLRTVIAIDGGLYERYAKVQEYLKDAIAELLGEEKAKQVVLELSKDGSGIGAALIASCYSK